LIFKSNEGNLDTIRITKKEISYNGLSEDYSGNPQVCYIYYQMVPPGKKELVGFGGRSGDVYSNEHLFLSAVKWKPDQPATIDIEYDGFGGSIPKKAFGNDTGYFDIIHFCKDCFGIDSSDVIKIRWKASEGIIYYQKNDSTVWNLNSRY
jgi:hypothetical protein